MKKRIFIALIGILVIAGSLAGIKFWQIKKMIAASSQMQMPPETITATAVAEDSWAMQLTAVGSLSAVQGVTIAAELPGKVVAIAFEAGQKVKAGDLLVRQDTTAEQALLPGAEATVALAETNLKRAKELLADQAVSQAELDAALANQQQRLAEAQNLRATIAKKNIRAPFAGRLGIRQVNLGQILREGDEIVTLQSLDPIYVDFQLPQQDIQVLQRGLKLQITTDALPGEVFEGEVTTISPKVEETTRNVKVQGLIRNPEELLRPGMYADVAVGLPQRKSVLAIPITAVLYAPYSDSVFVVDKAEGGEAQAGEGEKSDNQVLRQQFVRLGEKRGDFVEVVSGLQAGETVATTGVFKLRNKQAVTIDNSLQPEFQLQPKPRNK